MNKLYYEGPNPTVDLVILNHESKILLIKRKSTAEACPSMWALPGGFIDSLKGENSTIKKFIEGAETPEQAAKREVKEETNLFLDDNINILQVGIYEGNNRDPRDNEIGWSKSYAFFYNIPENIFNEQKENIRGLDDAEDVDWKTIDEIKNMKLAFDHSKIINDSLELYFNKKNKLKM